MQNFVSVIRAIMIDIVSVTYMHRSPAVGSIIPKNRIGKAEPTSRSILGEVIVLVVVTL